MKTAVLALALSTLLLARPREAAAVAWFPMPPEAYKFGELYPEAQRLLFAFDYGHALVYEMLLERKGQPLDDPEKLEKEIVRKIMAILKDPPHVKVDESDIAPNYVFTFPLIVDLFDWSHLLHQFIYDVLATSVDRGPRMMRRIRALNEKYRSQPSVMITDSCKTMLFMDGHYFSKAFRRAFPSFNLLIWSYHWLQVRLYEALMKPTRAGRDRGVRETVAGFRALVSDLPDSADFDMMPETAREAPSFAKAFPTIPAAFDNNHMLHDIVSDLLASDRVSRERLRAEGIRMGRMAQDPEAFKSHDCALR